MARILFLVLAIGLLVAAVADGMAIRNFVRDAARTDGVVVALNAGGSHPQIEFALPDGRRISYPQGGMIFGYAPGDQVRVLYRPGDPAGTASIDSFGALWFRPLLLGFLSAVFALGALFAQFR